MSLLRKKDQRVVCKNPLVNFATCLYRQRSDAVLPLLMFQHQIWCFQINFWCLMFWWQIWCWLGCCFGFPHFLSFRDESKFKILYRFLNLTCACLSFQIEKSMFTALRITYTPRHGRRKDFFHWGHQGIFPKISQGGLKVVKFVFSHSKLKKQPFLLKFKISGA